jgi:hypothetical protein
MPAPGSYEVTHIVWQLFPPPGGWGWIGTILPRESQQLGPVLSQINANGASAFVSTLWSDNTWTSKRYDPT